MKTVSEVVESDGKILKQNSVEIHLNKDMIEWGFGINFYSRDE